MIADVIPIMYFIIFCSDMSTEKENNSSQEGRSVNLVDNVAYEYINTK